MAVSDKSVCNKQLDLLAFPRTLLKLDLNIVIVIVICLHSQCCLTTPFGKSLLCGNQLNDFCSVKIMIYNANLLDQFSYNVVVVVVVVDI